MVMFEIPRSRKRIKRGGVFLHCWQAAEGTLSVGAFLKNLRK